MFAAGEPTHKRLQRSVVVLLNRWLSSSSGAACFCLLVLIAIASTLLLALDLARRGPSEALRQHVYRYQPVCSSSDNIGGRDYGFHRCAENIDVVYTWVNGSDPVWFKSMSEYKRRELLRRKCVVAVQWGARAGGAGAGGRSLHDKWCIPEGRLSQDVVCLLETIYGSGCGATFGGDNLTGMLHGALRCAFRFPHPVLVLLVVVVVVVADTATIGKACLTPRCRRAAQMPRQPQPIATVTTTSSGTRYGRWKSMHRGCDAFSSSPPTRSPRGSTSMTTESASSRAYCILCVVGGS
jgi:hypothetical protein